MKSKQQPNRIYTQIFKSIPNNVKIHLQAGPCTSPPYSQFQKLCQSCTQNEPCSFINLRGFKISKTDGNLVYGPYFPATKNPDLLRRCRSLRFNTKPCSKWAKSYALKKIRSTLRKALKRQMDVSRHTSNKPIQRDHIGGYRHMCDSCFTSIFIYHYVCAYCAIEICIDCYEGLNNTTIGLHTTDALPEKKHSQSEFVLFSKFSENSISELIGNTTMDLYDHLYNKHNNDHDEVTSDMPLSFLATNSAGYDLVKSRVAGYSGVARFDNIYDTSRLLPYDADLSVEKPSNLTVNHNIPCMANDNSATEPCHVASYQDISSSTCLGQNNQGSLSHNNLSSTTNIPYNYNGYASPPLADGSSATNSFNNTDYQSIRPAPFSPDSIYCIDHPYAYGYSPPFDALEAKNFGIHLPTFIDWNECIANLNQSRRRKSNILDNEQGVDLPTYKGSQVKANLKSDESYRGSGYYVSDKYSILNRGYMYDPSIGYPSGQLYQNNFFLYDDYTPSQFLYDDLDDTGIKDIDSYKQPCEPTTNRPMSIDTCINRNKLVCIPEYNTGHTPTIFFKSSQTNDFNYGDGICNKTENRVPSKKTKLYENTVNTEPCSNIPAEQRKFIVPIHSKTLSLKDLCQTQEPYIKPENNYDKRLNRHETSSINSDPHKIKEYQIINQDDVNNSNSKTSFLSCLYPKTQIKQEILHNLNQQAKASFTSIIQAEYLKMAASALKLEIFKKHWQTHRPIHITGSTGNSKFDWTPQMFSKVCGFDVIQATDYDNSIYELQAKEYFDAFSDRKKRQKLCKKLGSTEVLKIKDWPQSQDLKIRLPGIYDDFMRTVPVPEYCSATGYLNLANRLPEEYLPPDLGPKLFISYGSDNKGRTGKTNLHCDITDAVNLMYYADNETAKDKDKIKAASIWHIFPHDSLENLKAYITKYKHCNGLDPIFDHAFFLTQGDLKRLQEEFNVVPYTIYQNPGDAVFIPAGCAHQVINCSNSIKCAFDFLSPENVESSMFISSELKQDALQVQTTLAFAWISLKENKLF